MAGNVNTVLSLWPVLDHVTPRFMQKFDAASSQAAARRAHRPRPSARWLPIRARATR
jgi:hypothetical protein